MAALWSAALLLPTLVIGRPIRLARADSAGYALLFDGVNDFVEFPATAYVMGSGWETLKTVSLWVKPTGIATPCNLDIVPNCDAIFGDRPHWWGIWRGVLGGQDRIWVWNYDGSLGSILDMIPVEYTAGEWVHISLVHSAGVLRAYRNGVEVGSTPSGATLQPNDGSLPWLDLGGLIRNQEGNWTFEGEIDEVSLWAAARTPQEVQQDMCHSLTGEETGLRAYYGMSDGAGTVLTDDGPNSFDGQLYDGARGVPPNGAPAQWVPSDAFDAVPCLPTPYHLFVPLALRP